MLVVAWALMRASGRVCGKYLRLCNASVLLASLIFYFWGEGENVLLLVASIIANYYFGLVISHSSNGATRKAILTLAVFANLATLVFFKYSRALVESANCLLGTTLTVPAIALPLGISFYTFQAMSYVIDVYRRDVPPARSPLEFACYIAMFPQLVAGPIVRYSDIEASLLSRQVDLHRISSGMRRFLIGLVRKVAIANVVADFADRAWAMVGEGLGLPQAYAWLALICYTLQIYYDFSGYSDMAIGIGGMLGFDFPENFNFPYVAKSVREFWRRWHITLSSWFRDYLYIPLGGSRCSAARACLNGLIVFALCGLWHGASGMFLLWGLWHGLFIIAERMSPWRLEGSRAATVLAYVRTMAVVMFGWVLFRSESLTECRLFMLSLMGVASVAPKARVLAVDASPMLLSAVFVGAFLATGVSKRIKAISNKIFVGRLSVMAIVVDWCVTTILALYAILLIAGGSYNPFIYFRF